MQHVVRLARQELRPQRQVTYMELRQKSGKQQKPKRGEGWQKNLLRSQAPYHWANRTLMNPARDSNPESPDC